MHPSNLLIVVGISAAATTAEIDSVCSPVSTVFVTVPTSPTVETVYALNDGSSAAVGMKVPVDGVPQVPLTAITKTVIASVAPTQVINVIQASSPWEGQVAYSFTEENGTTTWLGATPPASASLITSTQVVTLQPVPPGYVTAPVKVTPVTSYLTLSPTKTLTETYKETQTQTNSTASASAGAYTGLASNGWNSSVSTFITLKSSAIGSVTIAGNLAQYSDTAYPVGPSGVVPLPHGIAPRHNKVRGITDIVLATIDGVAVSWTNNYDGTPLSASNVSPAIDPATATALQPEPESSQISGPVPSPVQTRSSPTSEPSLSALQPTASNASSPPVPVNTLAASSTATSAAAPTPFSSCGVMSGDFIIDFDDLPAFSAGPGDTDIPPIFNPYHKLFFQEYFGYVPPPSDPFPPVSSPQLAVYRADDSGTTGSPDAGLELTGEIGSGPRASESAYWIDAYSAYLGCTNPGPDDCSIMVKGYQNSSTFSVITQGFTLPPCPGMKNCSLALIEFADGFRNLTGLQIIATVGTTRVDWYMDNLSLGWSNNTCAAQLERSSGE